MGANTQARAGPHELRGWIMALGLGVQAGSPHRLQCGPVDRSFSLSRLSLLNCKMG